MNDTNKIVLSGRIGADAELSYFGDGTPTLKFRLASSRFLRVDPESKKPVHDTLWIGFQMIGGNAENLQQHCYRGRWVTVEGELRHYVTKDQITVHYVYGEVNFPPNDTTGGRAQTPSRATASPAPADAAPSARPSQALQQAASGPPAHLNPAPARVALPGAREATDGEDNWPF